MPKLLADTAEDVAYSGPYGKFFSDDTKVVYVRNDAYWGQDASMWGKLPAPKYLAHVIYKDNAAGSVALAQGEVDVSQQFNSNIQVLWLIMACPSPPAPEAPTASAPACRRLLQPAVARPEQRRGPQSDRHGSRLSLHHRQRDDHQSATFDQVPRSLMNPTPVNRPSMTKRLSKISSGLAMILKARSNC